MSYYTTFYSFKGGVGRTLTLANVAYGLAERGKRVAMLDLDLEAPGLGQFKEFQPKKRQKGFLDYAEAFSKSGECGPIDDYVHACDVTFEEGGELWLMPSGRRDGKYQRRLSDLSWRRLHDHAGTLPFVEGLQRELEKRVDPHYVLIDARTGLSDIGGLSTNLMADMVVLVFNLTKGCIDGSVEACESFFHRDSRPQEVQLVASPVPPSAGGKSDRVEKQLQYAAKKMADALLYGRKILRIDYDPAMVLAEELAVTEPDRYPAAQRYEELREIVQRANPREVWGPLEDARAFREKGRLDDAVDHLRSFVEQFDDNAEGWMELGGFLLESGRTDEAIQALRKSCRIAPRFAAARRRHGAALIAARRFHEAIDELKIAEERGDRSRELFELQAEAFAEIGDTARYAKARGRYASDLFRDLAGDTETEEPVDPEALHKEFVEVLGLRPPLPGFDVEEFWQLLMGQIWMSLGQKADIARSVLEGKQTPKQIFELQRRLKHEQQQTDTILGPEAPEVRRRLAEGLYDLGHEGSLDKALHGDAADTAILRWVASRTLDSNLKITLLEKALDQSPKDQLALNDLLRALAHAPPEDGRLWAKRAIELADGFEWEDSEEFEILFETGTSLGRLSSNAEGTNAQKRLITLAIDRLSRASTIQPDDPRALHNWGTALSKLTDLAEQDEKVYIYREAIEKYEQTLRIQPDDPQALTNWGAILSKLAELADQDRKVDIHRAAIEKYEQALSIQPDYPQALTNWGATLSKLAELAERDEKVDIYRAAIEKYEQALRIQPDDPQALTNWGAILSKLAELADQDRKVDIHRAAIEKYEQALNIQPNDPQALYNWGTDLSKLAELAERDEKVDIHRAAIEKYEQALSIQPDYPQTLSNWGAILSKLAELAERDEKSPLHRAAIEKYEQALNIQPNDPQALYNWGTDLSKLAELAERDEKVDIHRAAIEKYEQALSIQPDYPQTLSNWGAILSKLAELAERDEKVDIYRAAIEKYEQALRINPDDTQALYNWGAVLSKLAELTERDEKTALREAIEKFERANAIEPHSADYNLACAESRLGEIDTSVELLSRALLNGQPTVPYTLADPDFENLWEARPDFRAVLEDCQAKDSLKPLEDWNAEQQSP